MKQPWNLLLIIFLLSSCYASDDNMSYEVRDSAHGPRIDKEHLEAPARPQTDSILPQIDTNTANPIPPGSTDTAKLNLQ